MKFTRKAVSGIMPTVLLIGMLTSAFNIIPVLTELEEEWVPYVPSSQSVDLKFWILDGISYVNVSITFPDSGFRVEDWGTVVKEGYEIWVDSKIENWTGGAVFWIITLSYTYNLGRLEGGNYTFIFMAWNVTVKSVNFAVAPTTWTVDDDGPADFNTIQEAINAALDGDTIFVYNGTYNISEEQLVVNKAVSLIGENRESTIINGSSASQTRVEVSCDKVLISRFTIQNFHFGVSIQASDNTVIKDNIIRNSGTGLFTSSVSNGGANNNRIANNIIANNSVGIYLFGGFGPADGNTLTNNTVMSNENGIYIHGSRSNNIFGNNIINNTYSGVVFRSALSLNNSIFENNIRNNGNGTRFKGASGNFVYHNNFVNNTNQVYTEDSINFWDDGYPSGGNFWSDYIATANDTYFGPFQNETGSDGIGDTLFFIDGNNKDNYPLMKPYGGEHDIGITNVTTSKIEVVQGNNLNISIKIVNYGVNNETFNVIVYHDGLAVPSPDQADTFWDMGDVNRDGYIDLADLNLILAAFGSTPGDLNWNPDADLDEDLRVGPIDAMICAENFGSDVWTYFELSPNPIGKETVTLTSRTSTIITFSWNTTDVPYGNYTIIAKATAAPSETYATDNVEVDGLVNIIPEFPSAVILQLLMILSFIAVIFAKRRLPRKPKN